MIMIIIMMIPIIIIRMIIIMMMMMGVLDAINAKMVRCAAAGMLGDGIFTVPAAQAAHFNINEDSAERSDIQILK